MQKLKQKRPDLDILAFIHEIELHISTPNERKQQSTALPHVLIGSSQKLKTLLQKTVKKVTRKTHRKTPLDPKMNRISLGGIKYIETLNPTSNSSYRPRLMLSTPDCLNWRVYFISAPFTMRLGPDLYQLRDALKNLRTTHPTPKSLHLRSKKVFRTHPSSLLKSRSYWQKGTKYFTPSKRQYGLQMPPCSTLSSTNRLLCPSYGTVCSEKRAHKLSKELYNPHDQPMQRNLLDIIEEEEDVDQEHEVVKLDPKIAREVRIKTNSNDSTVSPSRSQHSEIGEDWRISLAVVSAALWNSAPLDLQPEETIHPVIPDVRRAATILPRGTAHLDRDGIHSERILSRSSYTNSKTTAIFGDDHLVIGHVEIGNRLKGSQQGLRR